MWGWQLRRIIRNQTVIALCLYCGACDREEHEAPHEPAARSSARRSASHARSVAPDIQITIQQEIDVAKRDPLIQRRHADFMRDLDDDPANANDPINPGWPYQRKEADDLAALYAVRYPLAGVEWILAFNDPRFPRHNLLTRFVMELQDFKPGMAMKLQRQMDSPERKGEFAKVLARHARSRDIGPMWDYLLDPSNQIGTEFELKELKRVLIGAEAGIDPDSAWERFRAQLPEEGAEREFVQTFGQMEPKTPYPVSFVDRILAGGHDVSALVQCAIWHCESPQSIASIESWLERDHAGFDPKPAFKEMGKWWLIRGKDSAAAEYWNSRAK